MFTRWLYYLRRHLGLSRSASYGVFLLLVLSSIALVGSVAYTHWKVPNTPLTDPKELALLEAWAAVLKRDA